MLECSFVPKHDNRRNTKNLGFGLVVLAPNFLISLRKIFNKIETEITKLIKEVVVNGQDH
jgi:hypothetical protein